MFDIDELLRQRLSQGLAATNVMDKFHEHLNSCQQCENQPFNLCPTGHKLLEEAAQKIEPNK